jgi:hypothetical protein
MESRNYHIGDPDYYLYPPSDDEQYGLSSRAYRGRKLVPAVYVAAIAATVIGALIGLLLP